MISTAVSSALMFLAALCAAILSVSIVLLPIYPWIWSLIALQISYRRENARRDRVYGQPRPGNRVNTHELADEVNELSIFEPETY